MKKIIVFVGGSAVGKTTLCEKIVNDYFNKDAFDNNLNIASILLSHTTREKRAGEIDGKDYNFVSKNEFKQLDLIEETKISDNFYGTSVEEISKKSKTYDYLFAVLDLKGYEKLKEIYKDKVKGIFVFSPIEVVEKRMLKRGDKKEKILDKIFKDLEERKFDLNYMTKFLDYTLFNYENKFDLTYRILIEYVQEIISN